MPKRALCAGLIAMSAATVIGAATTTVGGFSSMPPGGAFQQGWSVSTLPDVEPTRFALVNDGQRTVVEATADSAAASLSREWRTDAGTLPRLSWRWRVNRVIENSDLTTKQGDDFAARLYVFFDFPLDRLTLAERTKLRVARWWFGDQVPAAALCYVWANKEPVGTTAWNAYTRRARVIVLRNANDEIGEWATESRDLAADFRSAFGDAPPIVTGVAIAADTDQTGESVTAWFGDIDAGR